jgi:hypothetical protein
VHLLETANNLGQIKLVVNSEVLDHSLQLATAYHFHFNLKFSARLRSAQEFGHEYAICL